MSQAATNSSHKGRHVTSARALRFLFASGILGGHGKGKHREVGYNRKRAGQVKTMRARGLDVTSRKGFRRGGQGASRPGKPFSSFNSANAAAKRNKGFGRAVIGGGAAGLRSDGGGKVDHSATRAARIAAGQKKALAFMDSDRGQRIFKGLEAAEARRKWGDGSKGADLRKANKEARKDLHSLGIKKHTVDRLISRERRGQTLARFANRFQKLQPVGRHDGTFAGAFGMKPKPDHSATRAARIASGRAIAQKNVTRHPDGTLSLNRSRFRIQGTRTGEKYVAVDYRNNPQGRIDRYNGKVLARPGIAARQARAARAERRRNRRENGRRRLAQQTPSTLVTTSVNRLNQQRQKDLTALQDFAAGRRTTGRKQATKRIRALKSGL